MDTIDIERRLREEEFFDEETVIENKPPNIHILINKYILESDITHIDIIRRLNVERSYGYQLLNGRRTPTRTQLVKIGLMLQLDYIKFQQFLRVAGKESLYARNLIDAKIIYSIEHRLEYDKACDFIWNEQE